MKTHGPKEHNRKFCRLYPIAHTLYAQLNRPRYELLILIENSAGRECSPLETEAAYEVTQDER